MDSNQIKKLLDKYWEGETSVQEEKQLRAFFSQAEVPQEFKAVQPMFQFFKQEQEAYLNGGFDERLSSQLKAAEQKRQRRPALVRILSRAAAIAAICIGILWFYNTQVEHQRTELSELSVQEKQEALLAYKEAKAALMLVSRKMRKGTGKAQDGIVQVRKATKVIR